MAGFTCTGFVVVRFCGHFLHFVFEAPANDPFRLVDPPYSVHTGYECQDHPTLGDRNLTGVVELVLFVCQKRFVPSAVGVAAAEVRIGRQN